MNLDYAFEARTDLREIWQYIAQTSEPAADRVVKQILETCEMISLQPGIGQDCSRQRNALRRISSGKYLIFYLVRSDEQTIEIVRILHGARDTDRLF